MIRKRHQIAIAVAAVLLVGLIGAAASYGLYGHAQTREHQRAVARMASIVQRAHVRVTHQLSTVQRSRAYQGKVDASSNLLQAIVNRYGGVAITAASIGAPPANAYEMDEPGVTTAVNAADLWVYLKVEASKEAPSVNRALWEGSLVAGALRDEIEHSMPTSKLLGSSISVISADSGAELLHGGGIFRRPANEPHRDASAANVIAEVRSRVAKEGLNIQSIHLLAPIGHAPVVIASTNDPAAFIAHADGVVAGMFDAPRAFDGFYFEVRDSSGNPFFVQDFSYRNASSDMWIRPDLNPSQ